MSLKEFKELHEDIEEKRQKATFLFKIALKETLDNVIKIGGITKIKWNQYTPYFNDGDPCVFRVNSPSFYIENDVTLKSLLQQEEEEWYYVDYYYIDKNNFFIPEEIIELTKMFSNLDDYYFLNAFDDHCEIIYDGKEFEINDYNHD